MPTQYPNALNYSLTIAQKGSSCLNALRYGEFIPSQDLPIRLFAHSSGNFAVVFKIRLHGKDLALRCFLRASEDTEKRYREVERHIGSATPTWYTPFKFLTAEIDVYGKTYPVLSSDWIQGIKINKYISQNLDNQQQLSALQNSIIDLSRDLEIRQIGHGDLQSGNIFVIKDGSLKLIDYDNVFVPSLKGMQSLEIGHPDFTHPNRSLKDFNERIDRFSVWVMLTAIEAVKTDSGLWKRKSAGGYNTDDNFLFTSEDFSNPGMSTLFNVLSRSKSPAVKFYTDQLISFCGTTNLLQIPPPRSFDQPTIQKEPIAQDSHWQAPGDDRCRIISNPSAASILLNFQKIGSTPCELSSRLYLGKTLIISSGSRRKTFQIQPGDKEILIDL